MNKRLINPCYSGNESDTHGQKSNFLVTGSRQETEASCATAYPDNKQSNVLFRKKQDLKIKISDENSSSSAKKPSTLAFLDEFFSSPSPKSIESYLRIWMAEIVLALAHLHSHGIICRLVILTLIHDQIISFDVIFNEAA